MKTVKLEEPRLSTNVIHVIVNQPSVSLSGTSGVVPFDTIVNSKGNRLTKEGSSIVIGPGVSLVRVCFGIFACGGTRPWFIIRRIRDGTETSFAGDIATKSGTYQTYKNMDYVDVREGDKIIIRWDHSGTGLTINTDGGLSGRRSSYLIVEVIE